MKRALYFIKGLIITGFGVIALSCSEGKGTKDTSYLEEISVKELADAYRSGKLTISQVVEDYLYRIETIDKSGPGLNSVIAVNPDAVKIAKELEKELAEGRDRGIMHGIPVILKDNIDSRDSMPTTAGATVLAGNYVVRDSKVAELLREAGAIIIAKSNMSEWANFRASRSSSGWSGAGGQTRNPYVLDRTPCGSSSGSGVAVSANLCALAVGTETNGSIVCPSSINGVVGIKPTVGLVSRTGVIPISFTQDTPGPIARSVEDAAIMLGILASKDTADKASMVEGAKFYKNYTQFIKKDGLKGKRIALLTNVSFHHMVDSLMRDAVRAIKAAGAEVIEISFPLPQGASSASYTVMLYEFKYGLNKYLAEAGTGSKVKNIEELIAFNKRDSIELRYFDQALLYEANAKGGLEDPEYKEALKSMQLLMRSEGIDKLMKVYKLDAIMAPTDTPAWKIDLTDGDNYIGSSSSYAALSGYPSITLPMGYVNNLPVGISFFAGAWSEPMLIEIASGFESVKRERKAPQFITSLER